MKKLLLVFFLSFSFFSKAQPQMTYGEVYDYNIGDIYITRGESVPPSSPPIYVKKTITNKYYSSLFDTVFYVYDYYSYIPPACSLCSPTISSSAGNIIHYTNLNDTVGAGLGIVPQLDGPCVDTAGYTGEWLDTIFYDSQFCNILTARIRWVDNGPYFIDTCFQCFECWPGFKDFGKGVGLKSYLYDQCASAGNGCFQTLQLIWYKKGSDSCGTAPIITSIAPEMSNNSLTIFPNPSHDQFSVNLTGELKIYDVTGRLVQSQTVSRKQETVHCKLNAGLYFVTVADGAKLFTQKLVIE
jgi:hypothetical protein